ncbi:hypothetical protein CC86DRAFT_389054 [Ophiobolus disseminans]|uniref:Uncharacterized protein n=1 Tax=Ophiobolus disseminans TaxID=1469910 RepID=A0A6A6ZD79_9PLEO|nr:hypothetical protein CC86DRAFT_389054 [Ophiobolus disseminans]
MKSYIGAAIYPLLRIAVKSQELVHKKVEVKNKYTPLVTTSSCGGSNRSDSDNEDNNDSTNSTRRTRKRKRSLLATQDCEDSSGRRCRSDKRSKLGYRSRRQARKPNRGGANENDKYKLGYKTDQKWYYASGFKNSRRKLREFHNANLVGLGPLVRLEEWEKC